MNVADAEPVVTVATNVHDEVTPAKTAEKPSDVLVTDEMVGVRATESALHDA